MKGSGRVAPWISCLLPLLLLGAVAGFMLGRGDDPAAPPRSLTVVKASWPAWDTFQLGVERRENAMPAAGTTFLEKPDYVKALRAFQTGDAQAATLTIYEALLAASRGVPLRIVLLLDYTVGSDGVVAKNDIRTLTDLYGKRIGVERGTIAHFTLVKALDKAGIDREEVELVHLDLEALRRAFMAGDIQAVGTYEPYMSALASAGRGHVIFSSREIPRAICDVLFVREDIMRQYPDTIRHWRESWNDVLVFKAQEPGNYLAGLGRLNRTPLADLRKSLDGIYFAGLAENRMAFGTSDHPGYLVHSLEAMQQFMLHEGVIQQAVAIRDLLDHDGMQRFFRKR